MGVALTNAGVGRALFTTRFMLSVQAFKMCVLVGALPGALLPIFLWFAMTSQQSVDLVRLEAVSSVVSQDTPARWRLAGAGGERRVVEAELADGRFAEWFTPPQIRKLLKAPLARAMTSFHIVEALSVLGTLCGFIGVNLWLRRLGDSSQKDKRIRGALDLVDSKELSSLVKRAGGSGYSLAEVSLLKDGPQRGILVLGAQGTGKSVAIHDLMRQVFARKRKTIVYDQSGEFFRAYFRPGIDCFFNPALEGSVNWSIFEELKYTYDSDTMARGFLPPKAGVVSGASGFFEDAARALFSVILGRLKSRGARDTRDIARAFLEMPADEMEHLIAKSVASSAVGGDAKSQRQGVIASIAIYLNGIAAVAPGRWSVRQWIDEPDDSRLFILSTADTRTMFLPMYRLMLTVACAAIEAKQEVVHEDRYWLFLDEIPQLGDIRIDEVQATLRKYGVCTVAGIQSDKQFVQSMGTDRAEVVANCFNTTLVLGCNEPGLQERCAKLLGKQELDTVSRNQALANNESRDGAALNRSDTDKFSVMPSDVGLRDPFTGWVKISGNLPVASVDYRSWLERSFWAKKSRVAAGDPVVQLPPRNPRFLVAVDAAASEDPFDQVRAELDALKQSAAEDAEALSQAGTAGKSRTAAPEVGASTPQGGGRKAPKDAGAVILIRDRAVSAQPGANAAPASPPASVGGRGSHQLIPSSTSLLRASVDPETGEILVDEVGHRERKGLKLAQAMDSQKPGHTLGFDIGDLS